ncbi:MAG: HAD family hydrolase [Desulfobacteraceae bacterium]|nr:MAG: HAD family hydrolase [Desulfobacteraceae bacterium]
MSKIKGVFFDCYGTLFQYGDMAAAWNQWLDSIYAQCRELGMQTTREHFSIACHGFFSRPEPAGNEKLTVFERRMFQFLEELVLRFSLDDLRRIVHEAVAVWHGEISLAEDAAGLLNDLKKMGKKIALVSNFDHPPYLRYLLQEHKIDTCFDSIVISGDVGIKKPDPAIFNRALQATKLNPEEVAYVGDTDEDIAAARAARMLPILIQRNAHKNTFLDYQHNRSKHKSPIPEEGIDFLRIHHLNQLKEII